MTTKIFIGLGGHGCKVVHHLATHMKSAPNWQHMQNQHHFVVIDTDLHSLKQSNAIQQQWKLAPPNIDTRAFQEHLSHRKDPSTLQWLPSRKQYAFPNKPSKTRVEGRLHLYSMLERDTLYLCIQNILQQSRPLLQHNPTIEFLIVSAVNGGMGSGMFLPLGYWLQSQFANEYHIRTAFFLSLPSVFQGKMNQRMYSLGCARGYAALQELEYFNLSLGYRNAIEKCPFDVAPPTQPLLLYNKNPPTTHVSWSNHPMFPNLYVHNTSQPPYTTAHAPHLARTSTRT